MNVSSTSGIKLICCLIYCLPGYFIPLIDWKICTMALLGPPNIQPFKVAFRNYTSDEIKKLSVKEITHSQFFTEIGTPVPGGLYDSALGKKEIFLITLKFKTAKENWLEEHPYL